MTNTMKSIDEIIDNAEDLYDAIRLAREGMIAEPPFPREVWGIQIGTWPPRRFQSEEIARWYAEQPDTGKVGGETYPVKLVKGTEFSIAWEDA